MHFLLQPYNYNPSNQEGIPNLVVQHFNIVVITMIISLIIAIPLGILVSRYRRLYLPIVTVTGLLYTIPGLALVGILISILGLSFWAVLIPLVIYTQLVLIRNTSTAINGIDPLLIEVGRAMGMNERQVLFRITLPLALPLIIAGVRIATVTTIGIASLASLAGQGGLGDLIFRNIATADLDAVAAGGILMALFAILADVLLLALQTALSRGRSAPAAA